MEPPWLRVTSWSETMTKFILHGNISHMYGNDGVDTETKTINETIFQRHFNFSGLVSGFPFCLQKGISGIWNGSSFNYTQVKGKERYPWCATIVDGRDALDEKDWRHAYYLFTWRINGTMVTWSNTDFAGLSWGIGYRPFCDLFKKRNVTL